MSQQVIRANQQTRMRWSNGAGWTREIHAEPVAAETAAAVAVGTVAPRSTDVAWRWRLSIAEIETPAPFTVLPGIERETLLVHGAGLRLSAMVAGEHATAATVDLLPPQGRHRFAGEQALLGTPLDGPCHLLNLMWQREWLEASLWRRPLVGSMLLFLDPGEHGVVHVLAGHAEASAAADHAVLGMGDTLVLSPSGERVRVALDGAGEIVLAKLHPRR